MALQPDGKIVVAYSANFSSGVSPVCGLLRFNADGSQDTGFHANIPNRIPTPVFVACKGLALQTDGKILISISSTGPGTIIDGTLMRFNTDGSLDPVFGSGGTVAGDFGGTVRVQPDGRIVVVGANWAQGTTNPVAMARFYPNGNRDTTFGTSGEVLTNLGPNGLEPNDFVLQPDGKIVLEVRSTSGFLILGRFDPNGGLDQSFGASGVASVPLNLTPVVVPQELALQPDGRILVVADVTVAQVAQFAVVRFLGDGPISDPNQRFVTHLYLDLLGRSPDTSGLMTYTTALDQGQLTRMQVAQIITSSLEYRMLVVQGFYGRLLGRPADSAGLNNWVGFLNQGGTADQLESIFLGSAEYFNGRGGGTANGFLQALYDDVLGRSVDSSGAQAWGQVLARGVSPAAVATSVLTSQESDQRKVEELYGQVLHRPADASGLSTYTNLLQQGETETLVLAILAASDEYFARS